MVENEVVILGSYKPKNWGLMVKTIDYYESLGITVLSPRGRELVSFPLTDNQDFYYLKADLKLAGLTENDLVGKKTLDIIDVLDLRRLQGRICEIMRKSPLVHVVVEEGKIGKSVACELIVAKFNGCRIIVDNRVCKISREVPDKIRDFIIQELTNKQGNSIDIKKLAEIAEGILLRPKFHTYERPKDEWINI